MDRKAAAAALAVIFYLTCIYSISYAAEAKYPRVTKPAAPGRTAMPQRPADMAMLGGTIERVDSTNPADVKIQLKDDATGASRTISVAPWTNITKITDASELKTGDAVRVMVRKAEDRDVAMGILFGKIKNLPPIMPAPAAPPMSPLPAKHGAKK